MRMTEVLVLLQILYLVAVSPIREPAYVQGSPCIDYNSDKKAIEVICGSMRLSDVDMELDNDEILENQVDEVDEENEDEEEKKDISDSDKTWLLKANLVIGKDASFTIDQIDTNWLKIYSETDAAYSIRIMGTMKIDSVKITSWDPDEDDYVREGSDSNPRAFITVDNDATGTTNITNSELAYLGYDAPQSHGISYYGGNGSIIEGNDIHDNRFGFYSSSVSNIDLENNNIHDNVDYGLDPHSGTNDMIIRNNTVYDNGKMGIICSNDCKNIVIESNTVYNNVGSGIALSINMRHTIIRGNIVFNQTNTEDMEESYNGISISESSNNQIYNNRISNSDIGIFLRKNSSNNFINDNTLIDINNYAINVKGSDTLSNVFAGNYIDNSNHIVGVSNNTGSLFTNNGIGVIREAEYSTEKNSILHLERAMFLPNATIESLDESNNVVNISRSGAIKIIDPAGTTTNYDTDKLPISKKLSPWNNTHIESLSIRRSVNYSGRQ